MRNGIQDGRHAFAHLEGARRVSVAELLAAFGCVELDEMTAREVTGVLAQGGVRCRPSLFDVLARRGTVPRQEPAPLGFHSRGAVATRQNLQGESITVSPTPVFAVQGSLLAAIIVASIGYYRWWPYGLISVIAAAWTMVLLARAFPVAMARLPPEWSRGRILGAMVTTTVCVVAILLFVAVR